MGEADVFTHVGVTSSEPAWHLPHAHGDVSGGGIPSGLAAVALYPVSRACIEPAHGEKVVEGATGSPARQTPPHPVTR